MGDLKGVTVDSTGQLMILSQQLPGKWQRIWAGVYDLLVHRSGSPGRSRAGASDGHRRPQWSLSRPAGDQRTRPGVKGRAAVAGGE
jgi:hypothetical protein